MPCIVVKGETRGIGARGTLAANDGSYDSKFLEVFKWDLSGQYLISKLSCVAQKNSSVADFIEGHPKCIDIRCISKHIIVCEQLGCHPPSSSCTVKLSRGIKR